MPKEENNTAPKGRNPRVSKGGKQIVPPQCHIHHKVESDEIDDVRENVCVKSDKYPLREFEGDFYCLFHYPSKDKGNDGIKRFEEIFQERLKKTDEICAAIEAEFPDNKEKQSDAKKVRKIKYDFRFVWFPKRIILLDQKFLACTDFSSATFSSSANFNQTTFLECANFSFVKFLGNTGFKSATFSKIANFEETKFIKNVYFIETIFSKDSKTKFSNTKFEKDTFFVDAEFNNIVSFDSAVFGKESDVFFRRMLFEKNVDFQNCTSEGFLRFEKLCQGKENMFNFQDATFERASRISFHTCRLQPNWFVNIDSRKFVLIDINWENIDWKEKRNFREKFKFAFKSAKSGVRQFFGKTDETVCENITNELEKLNERKITDQKKRLLEIACRQLAVNAEENNRYEEASKFRYMAMETKRLENKGVRRFWNLHWVYKWSSGYGESSARAVVVLLGILLLFAVFYTTPFANFDFGEKKREIAGDAVDKQMDEVRADAERFRSLTWDESIVHSLSVAALQRPEPKAEGILTKFFIISETIFAPLQTALLALAIRRKFMR